MYETNRLTSVTPGRPDNRALGVQLPHSFSDPRTSPLRTPRRSGEYVQFDFRHEQLPLQSTINPLFRSTRLNRPDQSTRELARVRQALNVSSSCTLAIPKPPVERQICSTRKRTSPTRIMPPAPKRTLGCARVANERERSSSLPLSNDCTSNDQFH